MLEKPWIAVTTAILVMGSVASCEGTTSTPARGGPPPVAAASPPPRPDALLARAVSALGGRTALDRAGSIRVVYLGTEDATQIYQSRRPESPSPQRKQETLVIDVANRAASLRTEGAWSDGSPSVWRNTALAGSGFIMNLKTGRISRMAEQGAAELWQQLSWRVPHLALLDMERRLETLSWIGREEISGRLQEVCSFKTGAGAPFRVFFDANTGLLTGYEHVAGSLLGPTTVQFIFKPYARSATLGLFPSGYRMAIGGTLYRDLDVLDARSSDVADHPWFRPPPDATPPVSTVGQQPSESVEQVAPGVYVLRNVGGYNVLFAVVGDCVAVADAPARYALGNPLPSASKPPSLSEVIIEKVRESTGMRVCYVIPTHHHSDHFGGIAGFARAGAVIVTTKGNERLARRAVEDATGSAEPPKIEIVRDRMSLGSGEGRMEVIALQGSPHADEMLFVHFPAHRIMFEGDIADYVLSAKHFLRFVDERGIRIDAIYSSHSTSKLTLKDLEDDEPSN